MMETNITDHEKSKSKEQNYDVEKSATTTRWNSADDDHSFGGRQKDSLSVEHEFQFNPEDSEEHREASKKGGNKFKQVYVGSKQPNNQQKRWNPIANACMTASRQNKVTLVFLLVMVGMAAYLLSESNTIAWSHRSNDNGSYQLDPEEVAERVQDIKAELLKRSISLGTDLMDEDSPQYKAMYWIASQDAAKLDILDPTLLEKYALAVLFFSNSGRLVEEEKSKHNNLLAPVADWKKYDSWLKDENFCKWYGIECVEDNIMSVRALNITHNSLGGTIPSELFALSSLKIFELSYNDMVGTLPDIIFQTLTSLTIIKVRYNQFTGTIPSELVGITTLRDIHLCGNHLTGELPTQINQASQLTSLSLPGNRASGRIPNLDQLSNLQTLYLDQNRFTGNIPTFFAKMTSIVNFSLRGNQLTGTIPDNWGDLTNLGTLHLDDNALSGTVPDLFEKWTDLTEVHLFKNRLDGTIHDSLGSLTSLKSLQLYSNEFEGEIPSTIGSLSKLELMYLHGNRFNGVIPDMFDNFHELQELWLQNNNFVGGIPSSFANCDKLSHLYLDYNNLTGTIPIEFGNLSDLKIMKVGVNQLTGEMPKEVCNLFPEGSLGFLSADCTANGDLECNCCTRCY